MFKLLAAKFQTAAFKPWIAYGLAVEPVDNDHIALG